MTTIRLRYVDSYRDAGGKRRYYFRRGKGARTALPGKPTSREFRLAYEALMEGLPPVVAAPKKPQPSADFTFNRLAELYYRTPGFLAMKPQTQHVYKRVLAHFLTDHGHRDARQMKRSHVMSILADRAATPAAANNLLKKVKGLMRHALDLEWRTDDPTLGVKRYEEGEFHTWTEQELAQFEARWALGTAERTAYALHLYTGQRRSDVHVMRWPDADGVLRFTQVKTGMHMEIPVHPKLREALAAWPRKGDIIITGTHGQPFTSGSYGNFFQDATNGAKLPTRCASHGLRKAAARRLAEAGASEKEIAAITGHTTLKEVARYTRAASRSKLAKSAMELMQIP